MTFLKKSVFIGFWLSVERKKDCTYFGGGGILGFELRTSHLLDMYSIA
jgi:hypothetical protein